jgi:C1A family cysteine protease
MPADAVGGILEDGVYAWDDRDNDPTASESEETWDEARAKVTVPRANIVALPAGAISGCIRTLISQGAPVDFGMDVDQSYEDYDGSSVWTGPKGPSLGGHCQLIVGYHAAEDAFLVLNSWGSSWGRDGYSLIASSFVANQCTDFFGTVGGVVL